MLTIFYSNPSERDVQILFTKAGKTLSSLQFENAQQSLQNQKQSKIISNCHVKKRKRFVIDLNTQFAVIEEVIRAQARAERTEADWNRMDREKEAREQSKLLGRMQAFMTEWHVIDTVVADNTPS